MLLQVRSLLILTTILTINYLYADNADTANTGIPFTGRITTVNRTPLAGANLSIKEIGTGCITDEQGCFSLSIAPGTYTLRVSYIGYHPCDTVVNVQSPVSVNISMQPADQQLPEVTISAGIGIPSVAGYLSLTKKEIKQLPALLGERDPVKAMQLLPGIHSVVEGGTGMTVRGGGIDENLIMLDQATIYNPSHLLGFFSIFNPDIVEDIKVYKGNQPSCYGGRLSSVMEVTMEDGTGKNFQGAGEVGLLSSKLTLKGSMAAERFSVAVSGRRSYADYFFPMIDNPDYSQNKVYFYDLYGKASYLVGERKRLNVSGYTGNDVFRNPYGHSCYGNTMGSLQWISEGPTVSVRTSLVYSEYRYNIGNSTGNAASFQWESRIRETGIRHQMEVKLNSKNSLAAGLELLCHLFDPCTFSGQGLQSFFGHYALSGGRAYQGAVYAEHHFTLVDRFTVSYGGRFSGFFSEDDIMVEFIQGKPVKQQMASVKDASGREILNGFEPRINASLRLFGETWITLSWTRNRQYIHLANTSVASNPVDIWFPSNPDIVPEVADLYLAGIDGNLLMRRIKFTLEAFYKDFRTSLEFRDHTNLIPAGNITNSVIQGKGFASGLECRISKPEGRISGWISYAYTRSFRKFNELNNGQYFPSAYDVPHDFSVVINIKIIERLHFNATWVYMTGKPYTPPAGKAILNGTVVPLYSARNSANQPDYHRLDLSLVISGKPDKKIKGEWILSVFNAYNRKNVMNLQFLPESTNPLNLTVNRNYLFPVMPSVSYNIQF